MAQNPEPERPILVRAASDLHGHLPEIEPCDVLLLAGDLVPFEIENDHAACETWFSTRFAEWLDQAPATEVFACGGNHDYALAEFGTGVHERPFGARWTYVEDVEFTTRDGLWGYASPWTEGTSGVWAFEESEIQLSASFRAIPSGLDILMTHSPPKGRGDWVPVPDSTGGRGARGYHAGSKALLRAIRIQQPRLVVFGHIHEWGGWEGTRDGTTFANVCILGPDDQIARKPGEFLLRGP
jgi:Icc-related predicted phosphoesterase